jgi:MFS family permease
MSSHIAMVAMARWFTGARGRAIAIAALGFSIGEAFLPMTFAHLLTFIPWRVLWFIPIIVLIAFIPLLRVMLAKERTPQSIPDNEQTVGIAGIHWTRGQVIKSWFFWAILPVYLMPNAFGTALFFQQVHLANTKGWGHAEFVALFPLFTGTAVVSSIGFGVLIDRYGSARLIQFILLPMAISFWIFCYAETLGHAAIAFMFLGVMAGGTQPTSTAFWSEAFGTKYIGSIKAFAAAMMVMASAVGPMISGYLIDQGVPFHEQMFWIAGAVILVSVIAALAVHAIIEQMPALLR